MNSKEENEHTGADRAPDPKAVCLDCFCAVMQGNRRKAVIYVTDMNRLRDRAQEWLDKYKACEPCSGLLDTEDKAAIVAEYLRATAPYVKVESTNTETAKATSERIKALQGKAELLHGALVEEQNKRRKLEEALQASEKACDYMGSQLTEARGKIAAYEFVIRCNGMSGAEVR